ncbi:hypothetical protein INT43_005033 [Umbelopsis isabellina]|uniref:C2H2-type domain-containing protein n=1 Tax=Mortierella isabellina TaxID=91625 RepID=A0A8H7U8Q8_MORIS|nr:hypothetical protein INT43_005033 [Umbelopsis isabellina]
MNIDSLIEKPLKFKQVPMNNSEQKLGRKGRRRSSLRNGPKLFRCTGFGDCNMVFTRSEHLARHERKHTGEKPFSCVVPGCSRTFSRFDNMMQHTQTHSHQKVRHNKRSPVNPELKRQSQLRRASLPTESLRPLQIRPAPSPSTARNRMSWPQAQHYELPHQPSFGSILPSPYPSEASTPSLSHYQPSHYQPPRYEPSHYQPLYKKSFYPSVLSGDPSYPSQELSIQTNFSRNSTRRLSLADLHSPIDTMETDALPESTPSPTSEPRSPSTPTPPRPNSGMIKGIEITEDEYQALQGFGKFHMREVRKPEPMELDFKTPNIGSIRSNITVNESCERGR